MNPLETKFDAFKNIPCAPESTLVQLDVTCVARAATIQSETSVSVLWIAVMGGDSRT